MWIYIMHIVLRKTSNALDWSVIIRTAIWVTPNNISDYWANWLTDGRTCTGHTAPLATERSQLPAPDYGTVFHRTWKTLTYRTVSFGGR